MQLQKTNKKLIPYSDQLEELVRQRTISLENSNEKLLDENKELDLYVYRASHDLRGPLASLLGLAKIAQLESKERIALEYFNRIEESTLNLENILRKLLSVSKIKSHQPNRNILDLKEIYEETIFSYKNFITSSNIAVSFEFQESSKIFCDYYLLTTTLQNLIENAIYFRNSYHDFESKVKVTFRIQEGFQIIEVWDNGIGIDAIYQNQIFEMFFRVSEKSKGNGLGLFITKIATAKLGGEIFVESEPYAFSNFVIKIPIHA